MKLRVSAVQYALHPIERFEQFAQQAEHYVKTAAEFAADFILFPELFTTQLLSIGDGTGKGLSIERLPDFTEEYLSLFTELSRQHNVHIVAGTHITRKNNGLFNTAHLFYPDGRIASQDKLHVTPTETREWNFQGGEKLEVFPTSKGTVALLICYDMEFPELARMARGKGADIFFCPSCTDDRHGFHRVRYTCHARAVENEVYVVTTGTVGSLNNVDFMRSNFGQAAIITPNDIPFPPRGILAEGEVNQDMIVTADLDLSLLMEVREKGSVSTWRDRRTDLYPDWSERG